MKQTQKVCCGRCDSMIALKTPQEEISFKVEDIIFWGIGGVVVVWCKYCAASNIVVDEEYEKLHPEMVVGLLKRLCTFRAVIESWKSKKQLEDELKGEKVNV